MVLLRSADGGEFGVATLARGGNTLHQVLGELWSMPGFLLVTAVVALKRYRWTLD